MSELPPPRPHAPKDLTTAKLVGLLFGLFPFIAGLTYWVAIGAWHDAWVEAHRPLTPFQHARHTFYPIMLAVAFTMGCLLFHVVLRLLSWMLRDLELGLSRDGWKLLFAGSELAGFVLGAFLFFPSGMYK